MKITELPVRTKVYDRWWPWKIGVVVKQMKTRIKVLWSDGSIWTYDKPHMKFLTRGR